MIICCCIGYVYSPVCISKSNKQIKKRYNVWITVWNICENGYECCEAGAGAGPAWNRIIFRGAGAIAAPTLVSNIRMLKWSRFSLFPFTLTVQLYRLENLLQLLFIYTIFCVCVCAGIEYTGTVFKQKRFVLNAKTKQRPVKKCCLIWLHKKEVRYLLLT
jgi:hypothetical protein